MHVIFWLRGNPYHVEMTKHLLQAQFWQWRRINQKTGKEDITLVQGALRPTIWGAYEYIIPEDCLAEFLRIIAYLKPGVPSYDYAGKLNQMKGNFKMAFLRKFFEAEAIPKSIFEEVNKIPDTIYLNGSKRGLYHCVIPGVAFHVIGIKKDKWGLMNLKMENGIEVPFKEGYWQEMI